MHLFLVLWTPGENAGYIELCHSYPCPCPSQLAERVQTTNGCSVEFVDLLWAGVQV